MKRNNNLKKHLRYLLLGLLCFSCNQLGNTTITDSPKIKDLRNGTALEWKASSDSERMDASTEMIVATHSNQSYSDLEIHANALYLKNCIDEAIKDESSNHFKIAEIAAMCLVLKNADM